MTHVDIEQPTSKWYPMIQKKYVILCICISSTKCIVLGTLSFGYVLMLFIAVTLSI